MSKEKINKKENELSNLSDLTDFDLSSDYFCNVETGICGPTSDLKKREIKGEDK